MRQLSCCNLQSYIDRYDEENVEEWMGRLHVVAVECNYQEVDRQLKEQLLEEIIKELMATNSEYLCT